MEPSMKTILLTPNLLMTRKLESIFLLTDKEKEAISNLPIKTMALRSGQDISKVSDQPTISNITH